MRVSHISQVSGILHSWNLEYAFRMETVLNILYAHNHYLNKKFHESIRTEKTIRFIEHFIACFLLKDVFKFLRNTGLYCETWKN